MHVESSITANLIVCNKHNEFCKLQCSLGGLTCLDRYLRIILFKDDVYPHKKLWGCLMRVKASDVEKIG